MSGAPTRAPVRGVLAALSCYLLWGLAPLYWRELAAIDAHELIAHRLVWSLVFTAPLLWWLGGFAEARAALSTWRSFGLNFLSSALLTANWFVYVWAVNTGHVLETSLGYFLVPLINVALGWGVLHERLRPAQWGAIALAAAGVGLQLFQLGRLPWIALSVALTFGGYGLLRKQSALGPLTGLTVETFLLAPFAAALLLWRAHAGTGALSPGVVSSHVLFMVLCAGVVTAIPLLLFAYGARRLKLTTLGLLQYAAPSVQFILGVWVYHEVFSRERAMSFALIWAGLAVYTADALWAQRHHAMGAFSRPSPRAAR
jgi:chloramphenicol-sensitive protein RarD